MTYNVKKCRIKLSSTNVVGVIVMKYEDYIKSCKKFIAKFDNFVPAEGDGRQQKFKGLIDRYKVALSRLEKAKDEVVDACSLGSIDAKKASKNKIYPPEINAHHIRIASVIGIGVLLSMAGYVGLSLGGPNLEAWSSTLPWITAGVGAGFGLSVGAPIYVVNRKKFDREKVENRTHRFRLTQALDREQKILRDVDNRETALNRLVGLDMDELLSGHFSMMIKSVEERPERKLKFKKSIFFLRYEKTGNTKQVDVRKFRDEYENLPRKVKNELDRVLTKYNDEFARLSEIQDLLIKNGQEIQKYSRKKKTTPKKTSTVKQTTEQIDINNEPTEILIPDLITRADGTIVLGDNHYEIIDNIEEDVVEDTHALNGSTPVPQLPPSNINSNNGGGRK